MANQMLLSGHFATIVETFAYVEQAGVDVGAVLDAIETGGARSPQLSGLGRTYRQRRAGPPGPEADESGEHYLALYHKDVHYALLEGYRQDSWMPITAAVHELFKRARAEGGHGSWPIRLLDLWHQARSRPGTDRSQ
jgi:3-hydroxyisobutyrate dehydrogenase-like beta-hydroxyacid dehydrogenase